MAQVGRGMPPAKENVWKHMYKKEALMKLKWFHKNQKRLVEDCEKKSLRNELSPEVLEEVQKMRQDRYRNMERQGRMKAPDPELPDIDPYSIMHVMKPVDPKTKKLLYSSMGKEGRRNYLKERYKLKPVDRYYFPETSSFRYGWIPGESTDTRYGRQQVIKNSFYRRNGLLKNDPDFYRAPQKESPTVCSC
ncbi:hypothetical protein CBL_10212 [Carabus blaptoides fortunei]